LATGNTEKRPKKGVELKKGSSSGSDSLHKNRCLYKNVQRDDGKLKKRKGSSGYNERGSTRTGSEPTGDNCREVAPGRIERSYKGKWGRSFPTGGGAGEAIGTKKKKKQGSRRAAS